MPNFLQHEIHRHFLARLPVQCNGWTIYRLTEPDACKRSNILLQVSSAGAHEPAAVQRAL